MNERFKRRYTLLPLYDESPKSQLDEAFDKYKRTEKWGRFIWLRDFFTKQNARDIAQAIRETVFSRETAAFCLFVFSVGMMLWLAGDVPGFLYATGLIYMKASYRGPFRLLK